MRKPMTKHSNKAHSHITMPKILLGAVVLIMVAVVAYLVTYWMTFNKFTDVFDVSVLKNQIIANQQADEVKDQLKELGYSFEEEEFFRLDDPGESTRYFSDVLGGYEPEKIEDQVPEERGYYFYDKNGQAFFFSVGEENVVDPDSFVPLIIH